LVIEIVNVERRGMKKEAVSGIMMLLLTSMLTLAFNIHVVRASGTIYIRADGSVDGTDKIKRDGNVYTFTDNIYDEIEVQRSNIIVDGNGHTLQGSTYGRGFYLYNVNNVIIRNTNIKNFTYGIHLYYHSNNNTISGNNITENNVYGVYIEHSSSYNSIVGNNIRNDSWNGIYFYYFSDNNTVSGNNISDNSDGVYFYYSSYNTVFGNNMTDIETGVYFYNSSYNTVSSNNINSTSYGVYLSWSSSNNTISGNNITNNYNGGGVSLLYSSYNTVFGNNITNNYNGAYLYESSNNTVYHNNFLDNTQHVFIETPGYANTWDNGYPSGGNYWSDYTGADLYSGPYQNETGSDGIGDTLYIIDLDNQDNYPLVNPWSPILGDVNADGIVDIFDIGFTSAHWYPGPPIGPLGYNAIADINNDLAVDIFDIGITSAHWGQTW